MPLEAWAERLEADLDEAFSAARERAEADPSEVTRPQVWEQWRDVLVGEQGFSGIVANRRRADRDLFEKLAPFRDDAGEIDWERVPDDLEREFDDFHGPRPYVTLANARIGPISGPFNPAGRGTIRVAAIRVTAWWLGRTAS